MPKKMTKDIARFGASSMMLGAASVGAGAVGGAAGLSTVGSMMPLAGTAMMMGHTVRIASKALPKNLIPKIKKKRRRR